MTAQRRYGMDHEHYDWSPIVKRPILRWPENARLAFCVVVNLEHMEWIPPVESYQSHNLAGGADSRPISRGFPDYGRLSHREYGHRVGIFRVLKVLEKHGIKPTIAMDVLTAEKYPYLVRYCLDAGSEIIGHGISVSQMITSKMSEQGGAAIHPKNHNGSNRCQRCNACWLARARGRRVVKDSPVASRSRYSVCVRLGQRRAAVSHEYR